MRVFAVLLCSVALVGCGPNLRPSSVQSSLLRNAEAAAARGDLETAFARYLSLAESGVVLAMDETADRYLDGVGVEADASKAALWYGRAAEAGLTRAMRPLADRYARGDGVRQDDALALRWYLRAADAGDDGAAARGARLLLEGRGVPGGRPDIARALPLLERAAADGSVAAKLDLAELYEEGRYVQRNQAIADRWYREASANLVSEAEAGDVKAQRRLGDQFANGDGMPEDGERAALWYGRAADQGDLNSIVKLARLYDRGAANLSPDPVSAARLFRLALEQGHEDSAFSLGRMYADGRGVPRDGPRALALYERAIAAGDIRAYERAGRVWADSSIEPTDHERAAEFFEVGARRFGDARSMFRLAELHERERIADSDPALALMWYRLSQEGGYHRAPERVERMTRRLSAAELGRANQAFEAYRASDAASEVSR